MDQSCVPPTFLDCRLSSIQMLQRSELSASRKSVVTFGVIESLETGDVDYYAFRQYVAENNIMIHLQTIVSSNTINAIKYKLI